MGLFFSFLVFGRPKNLRERASRPETRYAGVNFWPLDSRSRWFLGQFFHFLVFAKPKNLRERASRKVSSVGFGPFLFFFRVWKAQNPTRACFPAARKVSSVGFGPFLFFFILWKAQKPTRACFPALEMAKNSAEMRRHRPGPKMDSA